MIFINLDWIFFELGWRFLISVFEIWDTHAYNSKSPNYVHLDQNRNSNQMVLYINFEPSDLKIGKP